MTNTISDRSVDSPVAVEPFSEGVGRPGPLGRLGAWSVDHSRLVLGVWLVGIVVLAMLAPNVERSLSGAGWQANGSQSVAVRDLAQANFVGQSSSSIDVVVTSQRPVSSPFVERKIANADRILSSNKDISAVIPPVVGVSISRDGHTAIIIGSAGANTNAMVVAADSLKGPIGALSGGGVSVAATGSSVLWSDFNSANRSAMMRSELFSWPVTLAILVIAFGSLVAAGLPLLLTIVGLLSAAGVLDLLTKITPISIWAMNFALMFALALGIDYALFMVVRFRAAHFGHDLGVRHSVAQTMDTAGKAVLFSGITVLVSLSTVMIVPSPAFRSMAAGIMLAVIFVLLATLTLLPIVLGKLGDRVDAASLAWVHQGEHRSQRFERWAKRLWRRPFVFGVGALGVLVLLAIPVLGLRTSMPSIKVVPPEASSRVGYGLIQQAFGPGSPGRLEIVTTRANLRTVQSDLARDAGIAVSTPAIASQTSPLLMIDAVPTTDPSAPATDSTIQRLRDVLPRGTLVGGAAAENYDLQRLLVKMTPVVIGIELALGFLLLLIALQALLAAAIGVLTSLLATAGAFGVARLVFQDGWGHGLLGFAPQGFLDAWGPVFFFAMIFAISMDYTVFLLSSAKEHLERSGDAKEAMIGGVAHSGRVIFAAAAVMVAVFFTFALSGPLPPKEMGIILGIAVLLDAGLVRLLLLPVLLRLTGKAAWWLPQWMRKVLPEVRFSHD